MNLKKKIFAATLSIFVCLMIIFLALSLSGCSDSAGGSKVNTVDESMGPNGVRKDMEAYIQTAYPESAKKRAALTSYARALQSAYTDVTNETEALNAETKIINALVCVTILGEEQGKKSPYRVIDEKMANTPERLAAELKYEKFLDGKVFEMPSIGSAPESVCDFDVNALAN